MRSAVYPEGHDLFAQRKLPAEPERRLDTVLETLQNG